MTVFGLLSLQVFLPKQFTRVCYSGNMEWCVHNCGKSHSQIFKPLKPLEISRVFISRAIKHYEELWRFEDRAWSGRPKSVRAEATIKTIRERILRNPFWKQKIMSRKLNISNQSTSASSGTI
jgi:hypothetical protein